MYICYKFWFNIGTGDGISEPTKISLEKEDWQNGPTGGLTEGISGLVCPSTEKSVETRTRNNRL
jgi:hypothetical protein